MSLRRDLVRRAAARHGLVTPADALAVGSSRMARVMLARCGAVECLASGIHRVTGLPDDPLQRRQEAPFRLPSGVLYHRTALDLHGLCGIATDAVHVTVPPPLRIRGQVPAWLTVHRADLDADDVTTHQGLAIVTPARAIVDAMTRSGPAWVAVTWTTPCRPPDDETTRPGPNGLRSRERSLPRLRQIDGIAP